MLEINPSSAAMSKGFIHCTLFTPAPSIYSFKPCHYSLGPISGNTDDIDVQCYCTCTTTKMLTGPPSLPPTVLSHLGPIFTHLSTLTPGSGTCSGLNKPQQPIHTCTRETNSPRHGHNDDREQKPPVIVAFVREHGHKQSHQHPIVAVKSSCNG